jgi:hypothetical protein
VDVGADDHLFINGALDRKPAGVELWVDVLDNNPSEELRVQ